MLEISEEFTRKGSLGKKYPKVYQAESITDMQKGRSEGAKGIHRTPGVLIRPIGFGSQPLNLAADGITAVIYLPEVRHYPAKDPNEDIRRMGGATIHDNLGMRLTDDCDPEGILVWYNSHSFIHFPYPTRFDDLGPGNNTFFNINKWKAYRDISWKLPVILLAQYTELTSGELKRLKEESDDFDDYNKPVTEQYWLLHVFDPEGVVRRKGRERIATPVRKLVPVFPPIVS